jgi:ankyrin repeat protein
MKRLISSGSLIALLLTITISAAGTAPVADAVMARDREAVKTLLKNGADVNAAQGDGMTALHWAARNGDAELTQMLLFAGANVKATTRLGGYTPLMMAADRATRR